MSVTIKRFGMTLGLALILSSCGGGPDVESPVIGGGPATAPPVTTAPEFEKGKELYESIQNGCAICHGNSGQGGTSTPIDLTKTLYTREDAPGVEYTLTDYIVKFMPTTGVAICELDCATEIAAYIRSWATSTGATPTPTPTPEPTMTPTSAPVGQDSDGDGVPDNMDACPNDAAAGQADGCPDFDAVRGEQLYDDVASGKGNCITCHDVAGTRGTSVLFGPMSDIIGPDGMFKCEKTTCTDINALIKYIDEEMPSGSPQNCVGTCARDVAFFIESTFQKVNANTDADAFIDIIDECDTTPGSVVDIVAVSGEFTGCAPSERDTDGDGVMDDDDACLDEVGVKPDGCPLLGG